MSKKFILAIQGEGRGHLTQAISMYELLIEKGHTVSAIIIGSSGSRKIPEFLNQKIKSPIIQLTSPNFVTDNKNKSINIRKSIIKGIREIKCYKSSLKKIDDILKTHQPDVIINFFDLLIGLYYRFYKPQIKLICVGHQYIYFHQDFEFPIGKMLDKFLIKSFTRLTAYGSSKNLALSFYNIHTNSKDVIVVPPLLRKEIFELKATKEDFFLVYLVNNGYFEEILAWHKDNPCEEIHCFTDQPETLYHLYKFDKNKLFIHAINDSLFMEMMSRSKGLASSAGFESVCEAMYLGKPVLMVPIKGHFEQFCNSRDGYKAGAGIFSDYFDLTKLIDFSITFNGINPRFIEWVSTAKLRIYNEISIS